MQRAVTKVVLAFAGSLFLPLAGHRLWNSAGASVREFRVAPAVFGVARPPQETRDEGRRFREQLDQLQRTVAQLAEVRVRDTAATSSLENARQFLSLQREMGREAAEVQVRALSDIREELRRTKGELATARATIDDLRDDLARLREQLVEAKRQPTVGSVRATRDHSPDEPVRGDPLRVPPLPPAASSSCPQPPIYVMPACVVAYPCQQFREEGKPHGCRH